MQSEVDESIAVDVLGERPRLQLVAHGVGERCASARRSLALVRTHDLRPTRIEMEVERLALVLTQRFVIELANYVPRDIAHHQSNDLLLDAALAILQRVANCFVERRRREPRP